MYKTYFKYLSIVLVIAMSAGVLGISTTNAFYNDTESSNANIFSASSLDFHLNPSTDFTPLPLNKGEATSTLLTLLNDGSLGFQYTASTTDMGGASDLCNYLNLQVNLNGVSVYNGLLSGFYVVAGNYVNPSAWNFVVTLPSGATDSLQDKTCNFKFTFNGWQEDLLSTQGFSDTEQISGSITSGHWSAPINSSVVLNEILPNPEGDDNQHGLQGEWVELYNNGNTSIDLAGWMIKDLAGNTKTISSANTMNGRTTIGPKGSYLEWVVVFMNDSILNNGGDTVYLKDPANNPIDQYAYGNSGNDSNSDSNSTGGGSNNNPSGSETAGNEGKSYARLPVDGTGEWVDPIPTPGEPNKMEEVLGGDGTTPDIAQVDVLPIVTEPAVTEPAVVEVEPVVTDPEPIVTPPALEEPAIVPEPVTEPILEPVIEPVIVPDPIVTPVVETPVVETPAPEPAPTEPAI